MKVTISRTKPLPPPVVPYPEIHHCKAFLVKDKSEYGGTMVCISFKTAIGCFENDGTVTYISNENEPALSWLMKYYDFVRYLDEHDVVSFTGGKS